MEALTLYVVLCLGGNADQCTAYEIDYNLSAEDCDHYYTDSGIQELESKLALYVPMYKTKDQNEVILSCEPTI